MLLNIKITAFLAFVVIILFLKIPEIKANQNSEKIKLLYKISLQSKFLTMPAVLYNEPVNIHDLIITLGDFYFEPIVIIGVGDSRINEEDDFGDEIDFIIGYKNRFNKLIYYDLNAAYYFINNFKRTNDDIIVLNAKMEFLLEELTRLPFKFYIAMQNQRKAGRKSPEGGIFYWFGFFASKDFKRFGKELNLGFDTYLFSSDGALNKKAEKFIYNRTTIFLDIPLTEKLSLTPYFILQLTNGSQTGEPEDYFRKNEVIWGISFDFNF